MDVVDKDWTGVCNPPRPEHLTQIPRGTNLGLGLAENCGSTCPNGHCYIMAINKSFGSVYV